MAFLKHRTFRPAMRFLLNQRAAADAGLRDWITQSRAAGLTIDVRALWEAGQAELFAAEAAREGFDAVVAAGGDGTLNEVVNGVLKVHAAECAIGVLPFGTANDFATACGIPLNDPAGALSLITEGFPTPVDVGRVNERCFINVASGGFIAEITTETPQAIKDWLGGLAYSLTGVVKLAQMATRPTRVRAPDFEWEGPMLFLTVANGRLAGGGFRVAPNALLNDRLLDVTLVPDVSSLEDFPSLMRDLLTQGVTDLEHMKFLQAPWLEVETAGGLRVNADGEPLEDEFYRFEVAREQVRIYLGPGAPVWSM